MNYYSGKKVGDLSRLVKLELLSNIAIDIEEYIEKYELFEDGIYTVILPFKNGEKVKAKVEIKDIEYRVIFIDEEKIGRLSNNEKHNLLNKEKLIM